jgi:hypothetical protein
VVSATWRQRRSDLPPAWRSYLSPRPREGSTLPRARDVLRDAPVDDVDLAERPRRAREGTPRPPSRAPRRGPQRGTRPRSARRARWSPPGRRPWRRARARREKLRSTSPSLLGPRRVDAGGGGDPTDVGPKPSKGFEIAQGRAACRSSGRPSARRPPWCEGAPKGALAPTSVGSSRPRGVGPATPTPDVGRGCPTLVASFRARRIPSAQSARRRAARRRLSSNPFEGLGPSSVGSRGEQSAAA